MQKLSQVIRAHFPGKENEGLRRRIRSMLDEDLPIRSLSLRLRGDASQSELVALEDAIAAGVDWT